MMNLKQMGLGFVSQGRRFLSRAAETEALRRVIVTAIALERYFLQHSNYPPVLVELVPKYLSTVPVDFIDGRELHYRLGNDGRFILYSIGLDGFDNGGQHVTAESLADDAWTYGRGFETIRPPADMDLVWPLPAIQSEVDRYQKVVAEKEAELEAMRKHAGELVPVLDPEMERLMRARYGLPVEK